MLLAFRFLFEFLKPPLLVKTGLFLKQFFRDGMVQVVDCDGMNLKLLVEDLKHANDSDHAVQFEAL